MKALRTALGLTLLITSACNTGRSRNAMSGVTTISDNVDKAVSCAVNGSMAAQTTSLDIALGQNELDELVTTVANRKVVNELQLWKQIGNQESLRLQALIAQAYAALPSQSTLREQSTEYYDNLLAFALIEIQQNNYKVDHYKIFDEVAHSKNGVPSHSYYTLAIQIENARQKGQQAVGRCD